MKEEQLSDNDLEQIALTCVWSIVDHPKGTGIYDQCNECSGDKKTCASYHKVGQIGIAKMKENGIKIYKQGKGYGYAI